MKIFWVCGFYDGSGYCYYVRVRHADANADGVMEGNPHEEIFLSRLTTGTRINLLWNR